MTDTLKHLQKATCIATTNIAFVKYWGRINDALRLPMNGSISMNLDSAFTTTTVEFDESLTADLFSLANQPADAKQSARVFSHVDRIRAMAGIQTRARVASENNFPTGAGIASSASAFAALSVATAKAAGLSLPERELTLLARQGSGSACRSVPAGFVEWHYGETNEASFAEQIAPPEHWDIRDLIAITQTTHKEVGSADGNKLVSTSPFNETRVKLAGASLNIIRRAILEKNWTTFGEETEREAIRLHVIAMTSQPPIYYWSPVTLAIIQAVTEWRRDGLEAYFTIDAGANVHVLAKAEDADEVENRLWQQEGVKIVLHNKPGMGAQVVESHLF
ncbi:MAG: diphosphomevalonate decarboxylase [Anaerolineae bacterium]|nr:diphosphomevalonate decarboxylase [Anaerolineae bacterium]